MHTEIKTYLASRQFDFSTLKEKFEAYIKDRAVPLDERWNAFKIADSNLKNDESWIVDFDSLPEDFIMYDGPVHADRHQIIETIDIVHRVEELQGLKKDDYGFGNRNHTEAMKVDLNHLKEEILEMNLECFQYDW